MSLAFKRTIEDFVCGHCGAEVKGNGYTNHCPSCLYSRHVDINPGDRASECGALMKPVALEIRGKDWIIVHECSRCGFRRKNRAVAEDSRDALIALGNI